MQTINIARPLVEVKEEAILDIHTTVTNHIEVTSNFPPSKQAEHAADFLVIQADKITNGSITTEQQARIEHILIIRLWRYAQNDAMLTALRAIRIATTITEVQTATNNLLIIPAYESPII